MNCSDKDKCSSCIFEILKKILILQKQDFDNENYVGCDKPFLGPVCNTICYNTRPIQLFNCSTGEAWSFSYTVDGVTSTSDVFRVESLDDCCCTCRILYLNPTTNSFVGTNEFVTIDLTCCGAVRCLNDTFIDLC